LGIAYSLSFEFIERIVNWKFVARAFEFDAEEKSTFDEWLGWELVLGWWSPNSK
jgi:hypothetical protein